METDGLRSPNGRLLVIPLVVSSLRMSESRGALEDVSNRAVEISCLHGPIIPYQAFCGHSWEDLANDDS
jgi:hypothetical protein